MKATLQVRVGPISLSGSSSSLKPPHNTQPYFRPALHRKRREWAQNSRKAHT